MASSRPPRPIREFSWNSPDLHRRYHICPEAGMARSVWLPYGAREVTPPLPPSLQPTGFQGVFFGLPVPSALSGWTRGGFSYWLFQLPHTRSGKTMPTPYHWCLGLGTVGFVTTPTCLCLWPSSFPAKDFSVADPLSRGRVSPSERTLFDRAWRFILNLFISHGRFSPLLLRRAKFRASPSHSRRWARFCQTGSGKTCDYDTDNALVVREAVVPRVSLRISGLFQEPPEPAGSSSAASQVASPESQPPAPVCMTFIGRGGR